MKNSLKETEYVDISASDLSASIQLVDVCEVVLKTRDTLKILIDQTGVDDSYEDILEMISAEAVNGTQIFQVTVTNTSPEKVYLLAATIGEIYPEVISQTIDGVKAKVIEHAVVPKNISNPDYFRNTLLGVLVGFAIAISVMSIREIREQNMNRYDDCSKQL